MNLCRFESNFIPELPPHGIGDSEYPGFRFHCRTDPESERKIKWAFSGTRIFNHCRVEESAEKGIPGKQKAVLEIAKGIIRGEDRLIIEAAQGIYSPQPVFFIFIYAAAVII